MIFKRDIVRHIETKNCPGCNAAIHGLRQREHTEICRARLEKLIRDEKAAKVKNGRKVESVVIRGAGAAPDETTDRCPEAKGVTCAHATTSISQREAAEARNDNGLSSVQHPDSLPASAEERDQKAGGDKCDSPLRGGGSLAERPTPENASQGCFVPESMWDCVMTGVARHDLGTDSLVSAAPKAVNIGDSEKSVTSKLSQRASTECGEAEKDGACASDAHARTNADGSNVSRQRVPSTCLRASQEASAPADAAKGVENDATASSTKGGKRAKAKSKELARSLGCGPSGTAKPTRRLRAKTRVFR